MKQAMTLLGLAGACAACCAFPLLVPILGASAVGIAWLSPQLVLGVGAAFVAAVLVVGLYRQKKAKATKGSCGCAGKAEQ